jgi:hypothetical protein
VGDAAPCRCDGDGRAAEPRGVRAGGRVEPGRELVGRCRGTTARESESRAVVRHRSELGVEERRVEGVELLPRRATVR